MDHLMVMHNLASMLRHKVTVGAFEVARVVVQVDMRVHSRVVPNKVGHIAHVHTLGALPLGHVRVGFAEVR